MKNIKKAIKEQFETDLGIMDIYTTLDTIMNSVDKALDKHKQELSEKSPRTAWTVKDLAEMCAKHDEDRLSGTMKLPYDTITFEMLIIESVMDAIDGRTYNKDKADQRAFNKQVEKACYLYE